MILESGVARGAQQMITMSVHVGILWLPSDARAGVRSCKRASVPLSISAVLLHRKVTFLDVKYSPGRPVGL
jgi:hypothetical protein